MQLKTVAMLAAISVTSLTWAQTARADQCEWVKEAIANRARTILAGHPNIVTFCEPCGDREPGPVTVADAVAVEHAPNVAGPPLHVVEIDGTGIDLAYTFVQTSPTRFDNLAALASCPAEGVSPHLDLPALITHDVAPCQAPPPVLDPMPAPPPAPPPAAPPTITVVNIAPAASWLLLLGACGATSLAWALGLVLATRRRRARMESLGNLPGR